MKPVFAVMVVLVALGCTHNVRKSPIQEVRALEDEHMLMWSEFAGISEEYNQHLADLHDMDYARAEPFRSYCEVDMIDYPSDIEALSARERLALLNLETDIVAGCIGELEWRFAAHMEEFHEPISYPREKFYSSAPENVPLKVMLRGAHQNIKGLLKYVGAIRARYEEHVEAYHRGGEE